jgi:hypothetical protein
MAAPVGPGTAKVVITGAATNWHIPSSILWGVYGVESAFGANIATSSAGAQGAFQFMPATAAGYDYPLTNSPNLSEFQKQADAAAHYLADLVKKHGGNWAAALNEYSGGGGKGYADKVNAAAKVTPSNAPGWAKGIAGAGQAVQHGEQAAAGAVSDTAGAIADVGKALARIAELLTSAEFWIRLGEGILGALLLAMGLRSLTGQATTPASVARTAVKAVR